MFFTVIIMLMLGEICNLKVVYDIEKKLPDKLELTNYQKLDLRANFLL